jgi:hypothetical protein
MNNLRPPRKLLVRASVAALASVGATVSVACGSAAIGEPAQPLECYLNDAGPDAAPSYLYSPQAGYTCKDRYAAADVGVGDTIPFDSATKDAGADR